MIIVYGGSEADYPGQAAPDLSADVAESLLARIRGLLQSLKPASLIGSLAPGADITFARAALAEQIPLKVLLPCDRDTFRTKKVESRGEPWTSHYDHIITTSFVTIDDRANLDPDDDGDRRRHNVAMLDDAAQSAGADGKRVWLITIRPRPTPSALSVTDDLVLRSEERGILSIDLDPSPQDPPRAFVVMPYGKKKDPRANRYLQCDPAFHRVYRPLLEDLDVTWTRADLQTDSGIIHSAMLLDLANSDLVLADLSAINFNVAYEIGIRHVFASRSTVLVDPHISSFKQAAPPFDINMIRMHHCDRGADDVTDEQAESAIRALRPVVETALSTTAADSPAHEWFQLAHVVRPFQPRSTMPQNQQAEASIRQSVAQAVQSADVGSMRAAAAQVAAVPDIADSTRRALRIELAAGLLQETAYADARDLLERARPEPGDPMHRTWLHKTVMAYRRLGEQSADPAMQREYWGIARMNLAQAEEAGYRDSETYGIWGGLLKRQLQFQRGGMDEAVAQTLFAEMERNYRLGFQLDPDYYTGVNLLMALRWSGRPKDDVFRTEFGETLTVTRFLARRALSEDPADFWAMVTLAELTLHEAFEIGAPIDPAVRQYAEAARFGRPDEIASTRFQLEFLRTCGDPADEIARVLAVLEQAR